MGRCHKWHTLTINAEQSIVYESLSSFTERTCSSARIRLHPDWQDSQRRKLTSLILPLRISYFTYIFDNVASSILTLDHTTAQEPADRKKIKLLCEISKLLPYVVASLCATFLPTVGLDDVRTLKKNSPCKRQET